MAGNLLPDLSTFCSPPLPSPPFPISVVFVVLVVVCLFPSLFYSYFASALCLALPYRVVLDADSQSNLFYLASHRKSAVIHIPSARYTDVSGRQSTCSAQHRRSITTTPCRRRALICSQSLSNLGEIQLHPDTIHKHHPRSTDEQSIREPVLVAYSKPYLSASVAATRVSSLANTSSQTRNFDHARTALLLNKDARG